MLAAVGFLDNFLRKSCRKIVNEEATQATKIKTVDQGMRRLLNSDLSKKKPAKIWSLLESEVDASVKVSFRVHRHEFSHIK